MASAAASRALRALAYLCRAAAIVLSVLVVALCLGTATDLGLVSIVMGLNDFVPTAVSGLLVIPTPLGGAFRGDFFLVAVFLFVLDWGLMRASSAVR